MKKKITIITTSTIVILIIIVLYVLYYLNYIPHKKYTNTDFNIMTYKSKIDKDNDGIDDQTDILNNARDYIKTKPKYKSKYYTTGYPNDEYGVCTDVVAFANFKRLWMYGTDTVEPSVSVITSIGIDHTAYLGTSRESIGWEKAHIYRPGKLAICADANPPITVEQYADKIGAELLIIGKNFKFEHVHGSKTWNFLGSRGELKGLPLPTMPGEHQLSNASGAFEALQCMQDKLPLKREAFESALKNTRITGRFSKVRNAPEVYLDVGHNPHAAKELAKTLSELPKATCQAAVFGMLSDKDRAQVCQIMASSFDKWYVSDLHGPRGGTAKDLCAMLGEAGVPQEKIRTFKTENMNMATIILLAL